MSAEQSQHAWWEDGCYCPVGGCICGTERDPLRLDTDESERASK